MGESFLQRLMESGPALGPSDYMAQTLIWNNFMHPPVEGRLYSCQRLWLSLLVEIAHVLFVPGRPEPLGLVAMRSRYGCVVMPVTVHKVRGVSMGGARGRCLVQVAARSHFRTEPSANIAHGRRAEVVCRSCFWVAEVSISQRGLPTPLPKARAVVEGCRDGRLLLAFYSVHVEAN